MFGRTGLLIWFSLGLVPAESGLGTLRGRITDLAETALAGVVVTVDGDCWRPHAERRLYTTHTAEGGEFRLEGLPGGVYCIRAEIPGWRTGEVHFVAVSSGSDSIVDLGLPLLGPGPKERTVISGLVVSQGQPLADATVTLQAVLNPSVRYQTRSGADGAYSLDLTHFVWGVPSGHFLLAVHKPGFALAASPVTVRFAGDSQHGLVIDLERSGKPGP